MREPRAWQEPPVPLVCSVRDPEGPTAGACPCPEPLGSRWLRPWLPLAPPGTGAAQPRGQVPPSGALSDQLPPNQQGFPPPADPRLQTPPQGLPRAFARAPATLRAGCPPRAPAAWPSSPGLLFLAAASSFAMISFVPPLHLPAENVHSQTRGPATLMAPSSGPESAEARWVRAELRGPRVIGDEGRPDGD